MPPSRIRPQWLPAPEPGPPAALNCPDPRASGGACASLPGSSGSQAAPATLPTELLYKIFSYLPVSTHCQCALVCRHWCNSLPSTRLCLAQWRQLHPPLPHASRTNLEQGYKSRSYPWLAAQRCALVPALECQYQEWLHQQDELKKSRRLRLNNIQEAQQRVQAAGSCLAGLLRYSLHQQMVQADQIRLDPAPIHWPDTEGVSRATFSPCSRWLATCVPSRGRIPPFFLRLHGWCNGSWQTQRLHAPPAEPVSLCRFTQTPVDRLLSVQGVNVRVWRREPDTGDWHHSVLCRTRSNYVIYMVSTMMNGDIITLSRKTIGEDSGFLMLISCYREEDADWDPATPYFSHLWPRTTSSAMRSCRLALGTRALLHPDRPEDNYRTNVIQIWYKNPKTSAPAGWCCQVTVLAEHHIVVQKTAFSPDGNYLLGWLSNGQLRLWALDAHYRLQPRPLSLSCQHPYEPSLSQLAPFRADEKQLAVAISPHQIQFCDQNADGDWHNGITIERPPQPDDPPDDVLRDLLLTPSGSILVWLTFWRVAIWSEDPAGRWHQRMERTREQHSRFLPQACLLEHGEAVCTMAADPTLSLWIHGTDSQGQLIRKACIAIDTPLRGIGANSPDGLSLLLGFMNEAPALLQAGTCTEKPGTRRHVQAM